MDIVLYYIRDNLVGTHYFIYAFILFGLMFSMIGYLFKQKYAKFDIKLATSQDAAKKIEKQNTKQVTNIIGRKNNNAIGDVKASVNQEVLKNIQTEKTVTTNISNDSQMKTIQPTILPNPVKKEPVVPKPIPNEEPNNVPSTPIKNLETTSSIQNANVSVVQPNLSGEIPEIK